MFSASIKVLGKVYTAKGKTVSETLANLKPDGVAKGVSVLTVSDGKNSRTKVLPTAKTCRLFSPSPLTREIALKNTSLMFS